MIRAGFCGVMVVMEQEGEDEEEVKEKKRRRSVGIALYRCLVCSKFHLKDWSAMVILFAV